MVKEKLSISKLNAIILADNEAFAKMSKKDKRITIAKDCIARIKCKQIQPISGDFIDISEIRYFEEDNEDKLPKNYGLKDVLSKSKFTCSACAKGSLFLSYVGRVNKVKIKNMECSNSVYDFEHKKLLQIFSLKQLALIELAFEGYQFLDVDKNGDNINIHASIKSDINDWRLQFLKLANGAEYDENKLLLAICQNIIDNDGNFKL